MKGKKLYMLLRTLDEGEFKLLGKAAVSPLMNSNQRVVALYEYLKLYYPDFERAGMQEEEMFAHLFPEEKYNDYKLRRVLSALSRLVMDFLAYLESRREEEEMPLLLIRALGRRNLFALFEKHSMALLEELERSPYRDQAYYKRKTEVFSNYYFHPFTDKRTIASERLQELVHDLDYRYALEMYRLGNELRNRERIFSERYQLSGIDAMASQYGDGILSENAIFRTYRSLLNAFQDEDNPALFRELKHNFITHVGEMRKEDRNLLFQQLLNYVIRRINQGDSTYYGEALGLYKMGLESGMLVNNGRISEATFSNIVMVSCEEGDYNWAESFIRHYEAFLDEESREDTKAHCYSLWHYFQGQYDEASQILASHRFSGVFQPSSRMTAIRILFEQFFDDESYLGLLLSQVKAFEKFLSRDRYLSEDRKQLHKNTLALIRRIASAIARKGPLEEIGEWALAEIDSGQAFLLRNWLRKKMLQLSADTGKMPGVTR